MPVRQVNVLEVLYSSKIPLKFEDIMDRLNLNKNIESILKTSPEKRLSVTLRQLEAKDVIKSVKIGKSVYYKHKGNDIKNLIVQVMVSPLDDRYKIEFMDLMTSRLSKERRASIDEEIKAYFENKGFLDEQAKKLEEKSKELVKKSEALGKKSEALLKIFEENKASLEEKTEEFEKNKASFEEKVEKNNVKIDNKENYFT